MLGALETCDAGRAGARPYPTSFADREAEHPIASMRLRLGWPTGFEPTRIVVEGALYNVT